MSKFGAKPARLLRKVCVVEAERGSDPTWWDRLPVHTPVNIKVEYPDGNRLDFFKGLISVPKQPKQEIGKTFSVCYTVFCLLYSLRNLTFKTLLLQATSTSWFWSF